MCEVIWGFPKSWGYPHSWMVQRENPKQKWMMTGDWWYPHLRNPQDFENGIVYDLGVSSNRNTQYLGYPLTVTFNVIWWVVWNSFYFSIYWVSNHPNWRTHFSEGLEPAASHGISDNCSILTFAVFISFDGWQMEICQGISWLSVVMQPCFSLACHGIFWNQPLEGW